VIHTVTMHKDGTLLHLKKGDVLLIDDEAQTVELYRTLDNSYAYILPTLIQEGVATSSLSVYDLAAVVSGLPVQAGDSPSPVNPPHRRLKLEA